MEFKQSTIPGALVACLLGLFSTGCEKVSQQDLAPALLPHIANVEAENERMRYFNGVDYCLNMQGNCLPEIIVTPTANLVGTSSRGENISGKNTNRVMLNKHFANTTGNPAAVKAFFNGPEWKQYFPVLATAVGAPYLKRLRSGECNIKRLEYDTKVFYYAGAGDLTPAKNEMVIEVTYK